MRRDHAPPSIHIYGYPPSDLDKALYSALWADFMLGRSEFASRARTRREHLDSLIDSLAEWYLMDAPLISHYISPQVLDLMDPARELEPRIRQLRRLDAIPREVRARTSRQTPIKFRVGQVFHHKRYSFLGVIVGWEVALKAPAGNADGNVVTQSAGQQLCFYHVL